MGTVAFPFNSFIQDTRPADQMKRVLHCGGCDIHLLPAMLATVPTKTCDGLKIVTRRQAIKHHRQADMTQADYRIESASPIVGPLLPVSGLAEYFVVNSETAVVMAAKSMTILPGEEIRVVHAPTGEVIFRKSATPSSEF